MGISSSYLLRTMAAQLQKDSLGKPPVQPTHAAWFLVLMWTTSHNPSLRALKEPPRNTLLFDHKVARKTQLSTLP
jgi:hypothetical protein